MSATGCSRLLVASALGFLLWSPAGADAAILKRVHSGTTTIPSTAGVTIPLELPDASKAFVVCSVNTTNTAAQQRVTCVLSDNQLVIDGGSGIVTPLTVSWYVAEFESGVTVQRGTVVFPFAANTPSSAPSLTSVDCTKSFVVLAGEQADGWYSSAYDEGITVRAVLGTSFASPCGVTAGSTTSTLNMARNASATGDVTAAWQVVTMDGATVLGRGVTAIAAANLTAIGGTGTPSNPATDFIVMSRSAGSEIGGKEAQYQVRGEFTSAFQITFTRLDTDGDANQQVDIVYEVVRLQDGGSAQRGQTVSSGTTTTMGNAGNIAAVDRSATVPFFSASGGKTSGSAASQSQVLGETSWRPTFPSTTQLQFTRGTSSSIVGTAGWFVVSFYKCANSRLCSVGATAGDASATVSWSPIYDPDCLSGTTPTSCEALVVRDTAPITWAPANGATYTVGTQPAGGPASMRVAFNGTGQSFSETAANGTQYYYRVYPRINGTTDYITDAGLTQAITQVSVTPSASVTWSYATTGGSTLNAPIAGYGRVYVASNGNKMVALDSSTGVELATAAITNGNLQSYLGWFPVSGGTSEAVIVGDGKGWLTRFDGVTAARVWTTQLPVDDIGLSSTGYIQAAVSAQLRDYAVCDGGTFQGAHAVDIIFVASRNNSQTVNKVWAVRADTGAVVWTSTPSTGMDRAAGQPYVDYCRNRLWVSAGNNAGQRSLWVIDTVTGAEIASFSGAGDQNASAPTLSWDSNTVWVGDAAGTISAFDAASPAFKYSLPLGGASPAITGFIWEDWFTPGRLYVPVTVGSARGVWCVQDDGASLSACSDWPVNPRTVTTGAVAQPMATDTAIFLPGSDGKVYQLNTSDGTLYMGDGRPFTVESGVALGGLSTEDGTQLFVGTSSGRSYRINLTNGNLP